MWDDDVLHHLWNCIENEIQVAEEELEKSFEMCSDIPLNIKKFHNSLENTSFLYSVTNFDFSNNLVAFGVQKFPKWVIFSKITCVVEVQISNFQKLSKFGN